jgi:hypothetical protein
MIKLYIKNVDIDLVTSTLNEIPSVGHPVQATVYVTLYGEQIIRGVTDDAGEIILPITEKDEIFMRVRSASGPRYYKQFEYTGKLKNGDIVYLANDE